MAAALPAGFGGFNHRHLSGATLYAASAAQPDPGQGCGGAAALQRRQDRGCRHRRDRGCAARGIGPGYPLRPADLSRGTGHRNYRARSETASNVERTERYFLGRAAAGRRPLRFGRGIKSDRCHRHDWRAASSSDFDFGCRDGMGHRDRCGHRQQSGQQPSGRFNRRQRRCRAIIPPITLCAPS